MAWAQDSDARPEINLCGGTLVHDFGDKGQGLFVFQVMEYQVFAIHYND